MPISDDSMPSAAAVRPDAGPTPLSRRQMLRGAASAGAAGLAVAALAGTPAFAAQRNASKPAPDGPAEHAVTGEPVVAHVRDAGTGEIDIYRGTSHIRMHDKELAARLARASQ